MFDLRVPGKRVESDDLRIIGVARALGEADKTAC